MGSVNVNRSKPQPSPLLKELGDGDYEDIESFWESSILDWDANYICDDICRGVKKCEEYDRMLAARGVEATVQDQLKELLGHDSTKLQLEPKKIQLLTEAMLGFLKMDKMPKKSKLVVKRMDISIRIVETICQLQPEIAFKPCPGEDYYTGKSIELQSAFQCALASKSEPLLGIINNKLLDSLKHDSETYFTQEAQKSQSREIDGDGETMSQVAAGKNPSDLLKLIFETSTLLPQAVRDEAMKVFKLIVNKNISLLNESIWEAAVTTPSPEMVQYLLLEIEDAMFLTGKNAAFVIENGTAPMWNMFPEEIRRAVISSPDFSLLRKIVSSGKADMVKAIIELEPSFIDVIVKQEGYEMLLQLLKDFNKGSAIEDKNDTYGIVRDLLVSSMIRDRNLSIQDIRDILQRSKMEAYEMCLHLPQFESDTQHGNFTNYVQGLKTMKAAFFRFEKALKYVSFPELSNQTLFMGSEDMRQDHREVRDIFDWLESRGVKQVLSLSVEDRLYCPHTDEDIVACVNTFGVKILKWKKLDMYLKGLDANIIEELHLYSSGNRSVRDQWLSQLPRFQRLKKLNVYLVEDVIRPRLINQIFKELKSDIENLYDGYDCSSTSDDEDTSGNLSGSPERGPKIKVSQIFWTKKSETMAIIDQNLDNRTSGILSPYLESFIQRFCGYYREHSKAKRTKVALIDSGVVVVRGRHGENLNDDVYSTLEHRIKGGISLVSKDDEEYTWWNATEPHGTQMAALICTLNPFCDLYVVKVAESNGSGITGYNVAKGIEWAHSQGVDVISLSLVAFSDPNKKMFEAIKAAREDDIVITCSTADEGNVSARSVGENNENVLSIAACDRWGNLLPQCRRTGFDYQFLGNNVYVGQVPYLRSHEVIEGSSVSTAIAAGMASLILACARISSPHLNQDIHGGDSRPQSWRCNTVKERFDSMSEGKWVILDNLCGQGELRKYYDFERLVRDSF